MHLQKRILIGWIASISIATAVSAAAPTDSHQADEQVVPLYASGPRSFAMLTLGDGPPTPVVFDTGTDENVLKEAYAKHLRLRVVGRTTLVDGATGKRRMVMEVALPRPQISGIPIKPAKAVSVPSAESDSVGVFGPGSFSGRLAVLELSLNRLRILAKGPRLSEVDAAPYVNGLPALNISVAGIPLSAHLDSGSDGGLGLSRSLLGKIPLEGPAYVLGTAVSALGEQKIYGGRIKGEVVIGPLRLKNPQVTFFLDGPPRANVGYELMRQIRLVMDPARKRSWVLDPADLSGPLDQFSGQFGPRNIRVENGKLVHQREGRPAYELKYVGGDLFEMPETGDEIQFGRRDGRIVSLEFISADGQVTSYARS